MGKKRGKTCTTRRQIGNFINFRNLHIITKSIGWSFTSLLLPTKTSISCDIRGIEATTFNLVHHRNTDSSSGIALHFTVSPTDTASLIDTISLRFNIITWYTKKTSLRWFFARNHHIQKIRVFRKKNYILRETIIFTHRKDHKTNEKEGDDCVLRHDIFKL